MHPSSSFGGNCSLPTAPSSDEEHDYYLPPHSIPLPPQKQNPLSNEYYSEVEEDQDDDEEFSMERSRGPSHVNPDDHPLNKILQQQQMQLQASSGVMLPPMPGSLTRSHPEKNLDIPPSTPTKSFVTPPPIFTDSSNPPPPPPDDELGEWQEYDLSIDELDRMQQSRKQTSDHSFRSSVRTSFSTTSKPSALTPEQLNESYKNTQLPSGTIQTSSGGYTKEHIYGVTLPPDNALVPFKFPIDNNDYSKTANHFGNTFPVTADGLPRSPYLDYKPSNGDRSAVFQFQSTLTSVEEALRQAKSGQYAVKRTYKFIDSWCAMELAHLDKQAQLILTEAHKSGHSSSSTQLTPEQLAFERQYKLYSGFHNPRGEQYDEMHRTQRAIIALYNTMEKEIQIKRKRIMHCRKLINDLHGNSQLLEHKIKKYNDDYKVYCAEKAKELAAVRKLEKECLSLLKQVKVAMGLEEEKEEKVEDQKSFLKQLKAIKNKTKVSLAGGPAEFCAQLATLAEEYQAAIQKGNNVIQQHQQRCSKLLGQLALVEAERIVLLNHTVSQFSKHSYLSQVPILSLFNDLLYNTFEIDPQYDFQDYLRRHRTSYGAPTQEPPEVYRLPCSPDDIRQQKVDVNPNSVFRVSLRQCMLIQKKDHENLTIPRIANVLIGAVKRLDGIGQEGIFRISHQQDELKMLRKQFESGNYDIPSWVNSPHAPAALFKEWLRELQDSLVPTENYAQWMTVAKTVNQPGVANNQSMTASPPTPSSSGMPSEATISRTVFSSDPQSEAAVLGLFDKLDDYSRAVITEIAVLCVEIAHPLNKRTNRMTIENLAIVFAPSFFRNPSDDTNDILLNSKNEVKMCSLLLATVGMKFCDLTALDAQYAMLPPSQQSAPMTPGPSTAMYSPAPMTPLSSHNMGGFFNSKPQNQSLFTNPAPPSHTSSYTSMSSINQQTIPENTPTTPRSTSSHQQSHFGSPSPPAPPPVNTPSRSNPPLFPPPFSATPSHSTSGTPPPVPPRRPTVGGPPPGLLQGFTPGQPIARQPPPPHHQ